MQPDVQVTDEEIEKRFSYHPPAGDTQKFIYGKVRDTARDFALIINELVPESREKAAAFTKLEEVVMWANAAVARRAEKIICPMCSKETIATPVATNSSGTKKFCLNCGREEA